MTTPTAPDNIDRLLEDWHRERPDLDATPMAVVGRVLTLGRQLEARANAALAPYGLKYTDLDVLATLRRSGRPCRLSPGALRESVLITSGAMTACLDRLERRGYLLRAPDPDDRRSMVAELTESGRNLIDTAIAVRFEEAADAVEILAQSDRARLAGLLRTLGRGLTSRPLAERAGVGE